MVEVQAVDNGQPGASKRGLGLSEAVLLAVAPIAGYQIAFAYHSGYMSAFRLPVGFVTIGLTDVLVATGAVGGLMLTLFWWADIVFISKAWIERPLGRAALRLSPMLLLLAVGIYLFGLKWREWIGIVLFLLVFGFFEFGFPLVTQWKIRGYSNKLAAQEESDRQVMSVTDYVAKAVGPNALLLLVIILIVILMSFASGRAAALDQREFLVLHGRPERVVLRIYGDNLVCASWNREEKTVGRHLFVYKVGDGSLNSGLRLEEIGPLHPSPDTNQISPPSPASRAGHDANPGRKRPYHSSDGCIEP